MIYAGNCLDILPTLASESVHTCVTSPPYFGLRNYDHPDQIGLEPTPGEFVDALVAVFRQVRRVLRDDGTVWVNLGDSYAGSWGAQSRGNSTGEAKSRLQGSSMLEARRIGAYPLGRNLSGSLKNTPGLKRKDLIGIPWRVAFALQEDGWFLRQDIIWSKPNPMPESVRDRCTKSHEYVFLLSKSRRYHFDAAAIAEPFANASVVRLAQNVAGQAGSERVPGKTNGPMKAVSDGEARNKRSVWTIPTTPSREAHFATFPEGLVQPCILAGCPSGGVVLDPFLGSGTTAVAAERLGRRWIGCELNPEYVEMAERRVRNTPPGLIFNAGGWA